MLTVDGSLRQRSPGCVCTLFSSDRGQCSPYLRSVNSRRSIAESTRETEGLGTFGLSTQPQSSHRLPVRMEHFRASILQEVVDIRLGPEQTEVPKTAGMGSSTV